jgi:site-specific recombinase XerD
MMIVQPIRDKEKIEFMKKIFLSYSKRDHLLFILGINSGLRIGDILKIKVQDVIDEKNKPKHFYELKEQKTGKVKKILLGKNVQKAIEIYMKDFKGNAENYLFFSKKGSNKPITRQHAWRIINNAARAVGIQDRIGTHTLRKTFGYHAYKSGSDIVLLQYIFNHSAPSTTLRYIGIVQDDIDQVIINLNL